MKEDKKVKFNDGKNEYEKSEKNEEVKFSNLNDMKIITKNSTKIIEITIDEKSEKKNDIQIIEIKKDEKKDKINIKKNKIEKEEKNEDEKNESYTNKSNLEYKKNKQDEENVLVKQEEKNKRINNISYNNINQLQGKNSNNFNYNNIINNNISNINNNFSYINNNYMIMNNNFYSNLIKLQPFLVNNYKNLIFPKNYNQTNANNKFFNLIPNFNNFCNYNPMLVNINNINNFIPYSNQAISFRNNNFVNSLNMIQNYNNITNSTASKNDIILEKKPNIPGYKQIIKTKYPIVKNNDENNNKKKKIDVNIINLEKIKSGEEKRTDVIVKNIPINYNSHDFLRIIDKELSIDSEKGNRTYNKFYLPPSRISGKNIGYFFINFVSPKHIIKFYEKFNGKILDQKKPKRNCQIYFSDGKFINDITRDIIRRPIIFNDTKNAEQNLLNIY